jgi:hypothetical protein
MRERLRHLAIELRRLAAAEADPVDRAVVEARAEAVERQLRALELGIRVIGAQR